MTIALRRTAPAIVSAGGIVVVVMLVLGVADYNATRWMGPVLAIGTAVTVLAGITLLPALLSALGAARSASSASASTVWPRIGRFVAGQAARARRRRCCALLVAGALGNLKRPRHARLHRAVPQPAGVRRGPAPAAGEVPARPGRAGRRRSIDAEVRHRGAAGARRAPSRTRTDLVGFSPRRAASRSSASRSTRTRSPRPPPR